MHWRGIKIVAEGFTRILRVSIVNYSLYVVKIEGILSQ